MDNLSPEEKFQQEQYGQITSSLHKLLQEADLSKAENGIRGRAAEILRPLADLAINLNGQKYSLSGLNSIDEIVAQLADDVQELTAAQIYELLSQVRPELQEKTGALLKLTDLKHCPGCEPEFAYAVTDSDHKSVTNDAVSFSQALDIFQNLLMACDKDKSLDMEKIIDILRNFADQDFYPKNNLKNYLLAAIDELCRFPDRFRVILLALINNFEIEGIDASEEEVLSSLDPEKDRGQNCEVIPSAKGRISSIAICLPDLHPLQAKTIKEFFLTFLHLIKSKVDEKDFQFRVIYKNEMQRDEFVRFLELYGVRNWENNVKFLKSSHAFTGKNNNHWLRDGALRLTDGSIMRSLMTHVLGVSAYDTLAIDENNEIFNAKIAFQGGNIISTGSHLFIGVDDIYVTALYYRRQKENRRFTGNDYQAILRNRSYESLSSEELEASRDLFCQSFNQEIVITGVDEQDRPFSNGHILPQYIFHEDMFMMPLADNNMLIGNNCGDVSKEQKKSLRKVLNLLEKMSIEASFIDQLQIDPDCYRATSDDMIFSFANTIIEDYQDQDLRVKKVYLPQYFTDTHAWAHQISIFENFDLTKLNRNASNFFTEKGYEVVPIPVFGSTVKNLGSVHCLTFEDRKF